ncbi:MAG: glycosyltransferase [Acidimicrobiales bacterium]
MTAAPPRSIAVFGDMPHHRDAQGRLHGLEPVVAQLDHWGALFDRMVLCGPLLPGPPPSGFAPYRTPGVELVELERAGGNDLRSKLAMIPRVPGWAWRTRRVARSVEAVHLRCPCNIGLVSIFSTWRATRYRYAIYAGVWRPYAGEPRSFGWQRRLLAGRWFGGPVSVYADRDPQRPHLEPFFSPSFTDEEWRAAEPVVAAKLADIAERPAEGPWRLVVVGRLTPNKNQQAAVRVLAAVVEAGLDATLEVLGDGPQLAALEALAAELGVADRGVPRHGRPARGHPHLRRVAHPAPHEQAGGVRQVLLEGMVQGVVPLLSHSPASGEISGHGSRGIVTDPERPDLIARSLLELVADRARWAAMVHDARAYTGAHTLEVFGQEVRNLLERQWRVHLPPPATGA